MNATFSPFPLRNAYLLVHSVTIGHVILAFMRLQLPSCSAGDTYPVSPSDPGATFPETPIEPCCPTPYLGGRHSPICFQGVEPLFSYSRGTRSHYEKFLHVRHWTIGHNQCKGARTSTERDKLLICSLRRSTDRRAADTYGHVFRRRPHPLLAQNRRTSDETLALYSFFC